MKELEARHIVDIIAKACGHEIRALEEYQPELRWIRVQDVSIKNNDMLNNMKNIFKEHDLWAKIITHGEVCRIEEISIKVNG